ncbi:MAG: hypothetical protein IPM46_06475 [Flavobacteriales bacterium]|nr:hypothetical protein [Flavobacteriales bacterium]
MKHSTLHRMTRSLCVLILCLAAIVPSSAQVARHAKPAEHRHSAGPERPGHHHEDMAGLLNMHEQEIHFTENKGQFDSPVLFRADFPLGQAIATADGMVVTAFDPEQVQRRIEEGFRIEEEQLQGKSTRELSWRRRGHAWKLRFIGASPAMRAEARDAHDEVNNYFVGDRARHATDVRSYQEIWYKDVYPGIDARYYPAADGSLEYDLLVMPGSDPKRIAIAHDGIERMWVNDKGELMVHTILGDMAHPAPHVYQRINGRETVVESKYVVEGRTPCASSWARTTVASPW